MRKIIYQTIETIAAYFPLLVCLAIITSISLTLCTPKEKTKTKPKVQPKTQQEVAIC